MNKQLNFFFRLIRTYYFSDNKVLKHSFHLSRINNNQLQITRYLVTTTFVTATICVVKKIFQKSFNEIDCIGHLKFD